MRKIILLVFILLFLTGCWTTPPPPEPEPNGIVYRALLVGVGDYMFFSSADLTAPPYNVVRLQKAFSEFRFGENEIEFEVINTLVNFDATKENILNGILETFADADDNDVSYFYYMGHGGVKDGIPVITPTDTRFTLETSISVHELEEHLSMISGTKVVFIESCHSGNFIGKGNDSFNDLVINIFSQQSKDLFNKESYQVLTSSAGDQYTWTHGIWSYFCRALLLGCQDLDADINEDEKVDLTELHDYINEWIKQNLCSCKYQAVQIYPEDSDFTIAEY